MQEDTFKSYDVHLFFFFQMGKNKLWQQLYHVRECVMSLLGKGIVRGIISLGGWHWPWPSGMVTKDFLFGI